MVGGGLDGDGQHVGRPVESRDEGVGERSILVHRGEVAEFSTMVPHAICAHEGPVEILTILNHDCGRAHLHGRDATG